MAARRFVHQVAGKTTHGLEFDSEAELELFLMGLGGVPPIPRAAPAGRGGGAVRSVGRPSFDALIAEAVARLGPRLGNGKLRPAARAVQQEIARVTPQGEVPTLGTIERFLRLNGARQNSREN